MSPFIIACLGVVILYAFARYALYEPAQAPPKEVVIIREEKVDVKKGKVKVSLRNYDTFLVEVRGKSYGDYYVALGTSSITPEMVVEALDPTQVYINKDMIVKIELMPETLEPLIMGISTFNYPKGVRESWVDYEYKHEREL